MAGITYSKAGVNLDDEHLAEKLLIKQLTFKRSGRGAFGKPLTEAGKTTGLIDFGDYALAMCTDSVGTKIRIAEAMNKWDTIGIDAIAMNVNDIIRIGAEPIAFVDYIAVDKPDPVMMEQIGIGLNEGARQSNMTIIGGESAVVPGLINGYDLAGTALGFMKKSEIITSEKVKHGDAIIGIRSSGLHSNGYTLARKVVEAAGMKYSDKFGDKTIGEVLIEPTRIYVKQILNLIRNVEVHGLAHITGGGLTKLIKMNDAVGYKIADPLEPQPIFRFLQEKGKIPNGEIYRTLNMGMGFCVVLDKKNADGALQILNKTDESKIIGEVTKEKGVRIPKLKVKLDKF
ncbi:MAG: phosphoribosylformylglycinamidine cyclo-ligase [Thermoplasmata archaeon HGW-Thermoplasmata-2]|nr:MAG: phosphoribosylformylglycinamidine cyclo-ligase [Thermoplasmata archaeon HGW-Thermoplasmata-2]